MQFSFDIAQSQTVIGFIVAETESHISVAAQTKKWKQATTCPDALYDGKLPCMSASVPIKVAAAVSPMALGMHSSTRSR